jgi:hypothetical protein
MPVQHWLPLPHYTQINTLSALMPTGQPAKHDLIAAEGKLHLMVST